jgi:hypothetical protein
MGLASCESPLKHLGISVTPKKSTLAYANANRPWELYESIFMQLLEKCQTETAAHCHRKFRFKNKLMSLDASIIELKMPEPSSLLGGKQQGDQPIMVDRLVGEASVKVYGWYHTVCDAEFPLVSVDWIDH